MGWQCRKRTSIQTCHTKPGVTDPDMAFEWDQRSVTLNQTEDGKALTEKTIVTDASDGGKCVAVNVRSRDSLSCVSLDTQLAIFSVCTSYTYTHVYL